jgi:predicted dehydrogenase
MISLFKKTDGGVIYGKPTDRPPHYLREAVRKELNDFHSVLNGTPIAPDKEILFNGTAARTAVAIAEAALESKNKGVPVKVDKVVSYS